MLLQRLYDEKLAQASYLLGCQATGEALVVDPDRDAERYVRAAAREGLRVTHVAETHIHADFVSGSRELAHRTGAALHLSAEGGPDWQYAFAVGRVHVRALHTPGHTPEHLAFVVTDTAATDQPVGVFTGDFVFAGDVGRPDLLERAAGVAGAMEAGARDLYRSLRRFAELPDYLQLWPGHGAGSACGKALGALPSTTLGYERLANWAFAARDEAAFVREVLAGQPEPPAYFARMKRVNRDGPAPLGTPLGAPPERLTGGRLAEALAADAAVLDTRPWAAYAAGHVPGTLHVPLGRGFPGWAGALVPYDRPLYLVAEDEAAAGEAAYDLARVGHAAPAGTFGPDALDAWRAARGPLGTVPELGAEALAAALFEGGATVLDVRGAAEWGAERIPGVPNVPLAALAERLDAVPAGRPLVMQCQGGARSAMATALLRARGFGDVRNFAGGLNAWRAAGLAVERGGDGRG